MSWPLHGAAWQYAYKLGGAERDLNAYHRFLWSNHLAYAATYEPEQRFGAARVHPSRRLLFDELAGVLADRGMDPARDVRSVMEVGCSMGYLLRHMETHVFPAARVLHGVDIDGYAVERGRQVLRGAGSRVHLSVGDATTIDGLLVASVRAVAVPWFRTDGRKMSRSNWNNPDERVLGLFLNGQALTVDGGEVLA